MRSGLLLQEVSQIPACCCFLQVIQPDVVLVTLDALVSDTSQLQEIAWEAIVVDERNSSQANLAKAHQSLREVESPCKVLLTAGNPVTVCDDVRLAATAGAVMKAAASSRYSQADITALKLLWRHNAAPH